MQQFTVPQFIDVESKIIGPLTTRQFVIILVAGVVIAVGYKIFDFSLFLVSGIFIAIVAIFFAFVKINGRPFHLFVVNAVQTIRRPNLRVWNNRTLINEQDETTEAIRPEAPAPLKPEFKKSRLAELALIVDTKGKYKGE
jgi:hypothetical protein